MLDRECIEKILESKLSNFFTQFEALSSIREMFPELVYLPPTRGWAGSPDFLLKLVELVIIDSPKYVVELGSGVSSVVLGSALRKFTKGKLESFDHDKDFYEKSLRFIEINSLVDTVSLNYCPLSTYTYNNNTWQWYNELIDTVSKEIDLLVVDGPPRRIQEKSRFPALPVLLDSLSKKATIVLDDANRLDENEVLTLWQKELYKKNIQYKFSIHPEYEKGLAVIQLQK